MAKETLLTLSARRSLADGMTLTIKAHPQIENWMKTRSGDRSGTASGVFTTPEGGQVVLYSMDDMNINDPGGQFYGSLARRGYIRDGSCYNLSFLRLVGISNPEGVKVRVQGVFPIDEMQQYCERASELTRLFFRSHITEFSFSVSTTVERALAIALE